jgi:hypothetical protein
MMSEVLCDRRIGVPLPLAMLLCRFIDMDKDDKIAPRDIYLAYDRYCNRTMDSLELVFQVYHSVAFMKPIANLSGSSDRLTGSSLSPLIWCNSFSSSSCPYSL